MLRVEETLPHRCNRPHQRAGIRALVFLVRLERDVLKHVRLHDDFVRVRLSQRHQRARSADDAACRCDDRCGEAEFAQWLNNFLVRRITASRAYLWRDFGNLIARAGLSGVGPLTWHAEEIHPAGSERGCVELLSAARVDGLVRLTERQIRLDESSVDRQSSGIPHPRVNRGRNIFADRFDETIADDNRRAIESFTGFHHNFSTDKRVDTDGFGAKTGRENFTRCSELTGERKSAN